MKVQTVEDAINATISSTVETAMIADIWPIASAVRIVSCVPA
jgi:hypothetical protein